MAKSEIHNSYLDMVDHPAHVKKLTVKQLEQLAKELRVELIEGLAQNGGHRLPFCFALMARRGFNRNRHHIQWP